jgi:predicted AAA+ superfamily ATPase
MIFQTLYLTFHGKYGNMIAMKLIERNIDKAGIQKLLDEFPVTAILGPRQCGKTTIAKEFRFDHYFDLENPRDAARLENPQIALENLRGLIVIDEIQRMPDLFPLIRYLVDTIPSQHYLILGSASRDLIRQGSESLAGRIAYYYLFGFGIRDIDPKDNQKLWVRGGLPLSFMSENDRKSLRWREQYVSTFLERDIPQLGINIPARTLHRFWSMIAHYHAQIINYRELSRSFGISDMTARKYTEILEGTFMLRVLQPWYANLKKRIVKTPKIYFRDSGLFHSLMNIDNLEQLTSHPKLGASWEGFAMDCACRAVGKRDDEFYFFALHTGGELDLFWQDSGRNWGVEFKYSDAPKLTKSMNNVVEYLDLSHLWVIYPGNQGYPLAAKVTVLPLSHLKNEWNYPVSF